MEPTEAAARKGARRENEKAPPSLIPPSVPLFSSGHSCSGLCDIHNLSPVCLASLISSKGLGEVIHCLSILQRESTWFKATAIFFS